MLLVAGLPAAAFIVHYALKRLPDWPARHVLVWLFGLGYFGALPMILIGAGALDKTMLNVLLSAAYLFGITGVGTFLLNLKFRKLQRERESPRS